MRHATIVSIVVGTLVAIFATTFHCVADTLPPTKAVHPMSRLPGSSIPLKKAILCPLIFVGEVVSQGNVEPSAPGQATFDQFNVKVVECLKGEVKGEVSLSMTVRTFPPKEAEMIPKEGERYVFFVQAEGQDARRHSVIRVLSASNEVIECVRTLVEMQADFADPPAVPPK